MSSVNLITVEPGYAGVRLDTWFRSYYPNLRHNKFQKLLRTGQIRVNGSRVKPGARLKIGQIIRVPPLTTFEASKSFKDNGVAISEKHIKTIKDRIIHRDDEFIVINKPSGLAVQGGTKVKLHIDGLLNFLKFEKSEPPRLVHRLDKDTSGALLLARTRESSQLALEFFRKKIIRKLYWSIVVGVPKTKVGMINLKLRKTKTKYGDRVVVDPEKGKQAKSLYYVQDTTGNATSFIRLEPLTGRTHQLRVHLKEGLGTPILGDQKYGGENILFQGSLMNNHLNLHARGLRFPTKGGKLITVYAPIPIHFSNLCNDLGFELKSNLDQFIQD